ncbi:hypothetical protein N1851_025806 [Merluccius polli]|uniref:Uncharacterized protein n=1 Tax=Merluccius polli TaxID=89951 RepID=A0AA47MD07_MERPO|nr:hypothetical protein N1851_025806 [Merluccius polli]
MEYRKYLTTGAAVPSRTARRWKRYVILLSSPVVLHSPHMILVLHSPHMILVLHSPHMILVLHSPPVILVLHSPHMILVLHSPHMILVLHSPPVILVLHSPPVVLVLHSSLILNYLVVYRPVKNLPSHSYHQSTKPLQTLPVQMVSIPVLKGILPERYIIHWTRFVKALALLLTESVTLQQIQEADILLRRFVKEMEDLYDFRGQSPFWVTCPRSKLSPKMPD